MKQDYLWNKTGADAEIEKLESALREFRYDENSLNLSAPFAEPAPKRSLFSFLSFGFAAAAACLALAVISWSVLNRPAMQNINLPEQAYSFPEGEKAITPSTLPGDIRADKAVATTAPRSKARAKPRKHIVLTARAEKRKSESDDLTKEEVYAYNQLMLALSITGDKLNLVKEKITGE